MTKTFLVVGLVVAALASFTEEASAKVPVIYQTGQHAFECGPLPDPYDKEPELAGYQAGYLCNITGVFWSYFSVRDCQPVAFKDSTYSDEPELAAAVKAKYPESAMKRGIWGKYGWMLLALLIVAGIVIAIKDKISGNDD